jgi:hypothetical protein
VCFCLRYENLTGGVELFGPMVNLNACGTEPAESQTSVYIAGYYNDGGNPKPRYWGNGTRHEFDITGGTAGI